MLTDKKRGIINLVTIIIIINICIIILIQLIGKLLKLK